MSTQGESAHYRLLKLLRERDGAFFPGPDLASALQMSRTAIWKNVQKLRTIGYGIESHPKEGYRLTDVPDVLIPEEILHGLNTSWLGRPYFYFPRTGSTNEELLALAAKGAPHGTLVVAEEQTAGRGRLQRNWISSAYVGIYMSVLLKSPIEVRDAPKSVLIAALALVKFLSTRYGLPASIKWPNDVLIRGRKIAGVLAEMQSDQEMIRFLVVGIGINVNQTREEMEGPFRYPATSLALELGYSVKRREVFLGYLHAFEREYERFLREGFASFLPELEEASGVLGKDVVIRCGQEEFAGKAAGFTPEGAIRIRRADGKEDVIWVGDITQVEGFS